MRIIGPSALLSAATSIRDGVSEVVLDLTDVIGLVGRAGEVLTRVEAMVDDAEALLRRGARAVDDVDRMLTDGEAMLDRIAGVIADAEKTAAGASATVMGAQEATRGASIVVTEAAAATAGAAGVVERADGLLARTGPLLDPVERIVADIDENELAALTRMIDHLPSLVDQLETVGPDVHEILESVDDLTTALAGMPGMTLLKRRGERREEQAGEPHIPS